ncbi:MAG: WbuC family cupin fold metalloprotein [Limisphaerales bacterium]
MKLITNQQLSDMLTTAGTVPRKRSHLVIHESPEDTVQRIFIGLKKGTYVRPHCHPDIGELGIVLTGACDFLSFDDQGIVTRRVKFGPEGECLAFDLQPNEWHSLVVQSDEVLFLEAKPGPYHPETISKFADWAPPEGEDGVDEFLDWMSAAQVGDSYVSAD